MLGQTCKALLRLGKKAICHFITRIFGKVNVVLNKIAPSSSALVDARHLLALLVRSEAVSGFRDEALNHCSGGAKESAHRHFFALDLMPLGDISRPGLMRSICKIHDLRGEEDHIGLGFYTGTRFHVDSKGFRRWGADGKGATSPCNTGIFA